MKKDKCEICNATLTDKNRSKSYKHRCKQCVAKEAKKKREQHNKDKKLTDDAEHKFIRPYLFRAQDFTHKWNVGYVVAGNEGAVLFPKMKDGTVSMSTQIYVLPETLTQYTGKTDDHKHHIFEGDILRFTNKESNDTALCTVVFAEGSFLYRDQTGSHFLMTGDFISSFDKEIIGNIFDNPELLEVKDDNIN